jgi:hypothetical protein
MPPRKPAPFNTPLPRFRVDLTRLCGDHRLTRLLESLQKQFGRLGTGQGFNLKRDTTSKCTPTFMHVFLGDVVCFRT